MSLTDPLLSRPLMHLAIEVGPPQELPIEDGRIRRLIPLLGGEVSGHHSGRVSPGGADWQIVHADGRIDIAARYILDLEGGQVEVESRGVRFAEPEVQRRLASGEAVDPGEVYFRTAMRFSTSAPDLVYLNHIVAVSRGRRLANRVLLDVHCIL